MIVDRDYVYVFGPEWADELLNAIERDPLAQNTMSEYGLTREDLRSYYLAQPHFDRIYRELLENGEDFVNDPVDTLLHAVKTAKDAEQKVIQHQRQILAGRKISKAGAVRNSIALFVRVITS